MTWFLPETGFVQCLGKFRFWKTAVMQARRCLRDEHAARKHGEFTRANILSDIQGSPQRNIVHSPCLTGPNLSNPS